MDLSGRMWGCMAGLLMASVAGVEADNSATGRVASALANIQELSRKTDVCVEISLNALENAFAAQDAVEKNVMAAMKSGDKAKMRAVEKQLDAAEEASEEAIDLVRRIVEYRTECADATAAAGREAALVTSASPAREAELTARRISKFGDAAQDAWKRADSLTQVLKKQWLLPVPAVPASPVPAAASSRSPTPAGRR